jgi:hypothetical protein
VFYLFSRTEWCSTINSHQGGTMSHPYDPFAPFGADPMEDVLSLQTFTADSEAEFAVETVSCTTNGCTTNSCSSSANTNGCTTNGCSCSGMGTLAPDPAT